MVARSGYHGTESGSPSASPCSQHWDFCTNFKESLSFLARYQQPKSGSPSKFQVAWGYRATTKSYTENRNSLLLSCYVLLFTIHLHTLHAVKATSLNNTVDLFMQNCCQFSNLHDKMTWIPDLWGHPGFLKYL